MIKKVVYYDGDVVFIMHDSENPRRAFWYWVVSWHDVADYFRTNTKAFNELVNENLSIAHCEEFLNDPDNDILGTACGHFKTLEDALDNLNA